MVTDSGRARRTALDETPRTGRLLLGTVALGAVVRLAMLTTKWSDPILLNDSLWYSAQANQLIHGEGFAYAFGPHRTAEHGPLTPLLLAPVSWGNDPSWQRLVMTVMGIGVVLLIGLIATELINPQCGVIAAGIAAIYPNLWLSDGVVMAETPTLLMMCLAVWALLRARRAVRSDGRVVWWLVGAGVAIGLATLGRSEMALLIPLYGFVAMRIVPDGAARRGSRGLLVVGLALLTISPWVVRNLLVFDHPVVLTTNDGATLLGANCPDTYYTDRIGGWSLVCVLEGGSPADEEGSARSVRYRDQAVAYASDHVTRMPVVVLARVGRLVEVFHPEQQTNGDVGEDRDRWAVWLGFGMWWPVLALAVLGARRFATRDRLLVVAPVLICVLVAIVFYGSRRLRAPAEPMLVIAAAAAIEGWWTQRSRSRHTVTSF